MRFWFQKQKRPLNLTVYNTKLRLHEYRSEPALVSAAQKILNDPDFKLMMQVVANEHPGNTVFTPSIETHVRAAHQAKGEGYTLSLSNFEALGIPKKVVEITEPTFEAETLET